MITYAMSIKIDDNICGACGKRATMFFVHGFRCKEHEFQHEPSDAIFGDNIIFVFPKRGVAQPGSAFVLGAKGRRFESCHPE